MKFRVFAMMALKFLGVDKVASQRVAESGSYKKGLEGTYFANANIENNPIYFPSKKQQIKRKRMLAKKR